MSRSGFVSQDGNPGKLWILVGLPMAGKSSFGNIWVREAVRNPTANPRVVLGGDDFRYGITRGEFNPSAESFVFAGLEAAARALLRRGFDVLIDETHTTLRSISRWVNVCPDVALMWVDAEPELCKQRARQAGKPFLIPHIDRLAAQLVELKRGWPDNFESLKKTIKDRQAVDIVG